MNNYNENEEIFKTANIIIAGVTGAGKSTLINAVFGEEMAKTGKGRPVTDQIKEYSNPDIPVRIWDSIGFEIGANNSGVSKTKESITKIKKTIEEQASKDPVDQIHAIWYCINQGGGRYQDTEAEFVKDLHSIGVPFIIVVTLCIDNDEELIKEIYDLNQKNGITDIPVIEVLAQDKTVRGGLRISAFGLESLVDTTLEMLPSFIKGSFIAGQQIKVVLKREECESIITHYEKLAKEGFWDKVPLINMATVDKKFKKMVKEIFSVYNQILPENEYDDIIFELSKSWSKGLFSWCCVPSLFSKSQDKLEKLVADIEANGADGLALENVKFDDSQKAARAITYYGYTLLMAIEDVWTMIREEKIKNIDAIVIPIIKERIHYYLNNKNESQRKQQSTSIRRR